MYLKVFERFFWGFAANTATYYSPALRAPTRDRASDYAAVETQMKPL